MNTLNRFKSIEPQHKKWYVVSNITKSLVLGYYSYNCLEILYLLYFYGIWDADKILFMGAVYSSVDLISIIKVPKLANSTLIHHILVNIMYFYTLSNHMSYHSLSRSNCYICSI